MSTITPIPSGRFRTFARLLACLFTLLLQPCGRVQPAVAQAPPLKFTPTNPGYRLVPGPTGARGLKGDKGDPGPMGPPGGGGTGTGAAVGVNVKSPPSPLVAARGDGMTDDADAIDTCIQYAQDHGGPVLFPPGVYLITHPLHVAVSIGPGGAGLLDHFATQGGLQSGFTLIGLGSHQGVPGDNRGVVILMRGQAQEALLLIGAQAAYHSRIENITFDGGSDSQGTIACIKSRATYWSGLELRSDQCQGADYAIWIGNQDGGGDGEFFNLYDVFLSGRKSMVRMTEGAGQATPCTWVGVQGGTKNGGVLFDLGGGSRNVSLFGLSDTSEVGPLPNTLIGSGGGVEISMTGGRLEHVNRIYSGPGGGTASGHIVVRDVAFDGIQGSANLIDGGNGDSQETITVENCAIACYDPAPGTALKINMMSARNRAYFIRDTFTGYSDTTALTTPSGVSLQDCRTTATGATPVTNPLLAPLTHN